METMTHEEFCDYAKTFKTCDVELALIHHSPDIASKTNSEIIQSHHHFEDYTLHFKYVLDEDLWYLWNDIRE